ncbi:uncharacterized protein [Apostichopus japonicus]
MEIWALTLLILVPGCIADDVKHFVCRGPDEGRNDPSNYTDRPTHSAPTIYSDPPTNSDPLINSDPTTYTEQPTYSIESTTPNITTPIITTTPKITTPLITTTPAITTPTITTPTITTPAITTPTITTPAITTPTITTPKITTPIITTPAITTPTITTPTITTPTITTQTITTPTVATHDDSHIVQYIFPILSLTCSDEISTVSKLFISTGSDHNGTNGTVSFPNQETDDIFFSIAPGEGIHIDVPDTAVSSVVNHRDGTILLNATMVVSANETVIVYVQQYCDYTAASGKQCGTTYRVKGLDEIGREYWVLMDYLDNIVKIGILALEDDTIVRLIPPSTSLEETLEVTIDTHQTLYVGYRSDLSGAKIYASGPILVLFSYQSYPNLPSTGGLACTSLVSYLEAVFRWQRTVALFKSWRDLYATYKLLSTSAAQINVTSQHGYRDELSVTPGEVITRQFGDSNSAYYVAELRSTSPILVLNIAIEDRLPILVPTFSRTVVKELVFPLAPVVGPNFYLLFLWLSEGGDRNKVSVDNVQSMDWALTGTGKYPFAASYVEPGSHTVKTLDNVTHIVRAYIFNEGEGSTRVHWFSLL